MPHKITLIHFISVISVAIFTAFFEAIIWCPVFEEKRSEQRRKTKLVVVGIVTKCEHDQTLIGCPIRCETIDISGHGMQIIADIELPPSTRMEISVAYSLENIFHIGAEVRWHKLVDENHYLGIQLAQNEDSDFDKWLQVIKAEI